jgi:dihydroorotase
VAACFRIAERGYIREGYYADMFLLDLNAQQTISKENILAKCGWSPLEGKTMRGRITHTFVNGNPVWENNMVQDQFKGSRLTFDR